MESQNDNTGVDRDNQIVNMNDNTEIAVSVNRIIYSYGKENVLSGVTMTITKGTIYGLLGASGCGKTTTLRILIGILKPSSGSVSVFGNSPGSSSSRIPGNGVGYMPQDIALSTLFTINESMIYYATLNQMKSNNRNERMKHLSTLLKLPDGNTQISTLSGGQKRRASLAIALLHEAPLLILDEPTVGVDSLLRETIWTHLKEICAKNGQTIIITTHYIEEAKASHCIGLMRKGILLIEDNPQMIMQKTNESSLEKAFLKLSYDQEYESKGNESINVGKFQETSHSSVHYNKNANQTFITIKSKNSNQSAAVISALLMKHFMIFKRNFILLSFYMTILPFFLVAQYAITTNNFHYVPMALYNPDSPPLSSKFIIDNIDPTFITLVEYDTLSEAIESVKNYETNGVIVFPKNYTQSMQIALYDCYDGTNKTNDNLNYKVINSRNDENTSLDYYTESEDTLNTDLKKNVVLKTQIELLVDYSNVLLIRDVIKELYKTFKRVAEETQNFSKSLTERPIESPVKVISPPIYGEYDYGYRSFFIHTNFFATVFPFSLGMAGLILFVERRDRIIERSYASGVKSYHFILSHFISQSYISAFQVMSVQLSIYLLFGIVCEGSIVLAFVLYFIQTLFGIALSLFLCSLCSNENHALFLIIGLLWPVSSLSAAFWPITGFDRVKRKIMEYSPQAYTNEAVRSVYGRGFGLSSPIVMQGLITSLIWITVTLLLAIFMFRKRL